MSQYCHFFTTKLCSNLTSNNFIIHSPSSDKSFFTLETNIHLLEKHYLWIFFLYLKQFFHQHHYSLLCYYCICQMVLSSKHIQCITDSFQWATLHNFLAHLFFYSLYRLALLSKTNKILLSCGTHTTFIKAFFYPHYSSLQITSLSLIHLQTHSSFSIILVLMTSLLFFVPISMLLNLLNP
jgi:hypothetical protein